MFKNIRTQEFLDQVKADDKAEIIDVRTPEEYKEGYIEGATLIDIYNKDFMDNLMKLDKNKNYYVYCRSGGRSSKACSVMSQSGFTGELYNLEGGMMEWEGEVQK